MIQREKLMTSENFRENGLEMGDDCIKLFSAEKKFLKMFVLHCSMGNLNDQSTSTQFILTKILSQDSNQPENIVPDGKKKIYQVSGLYTPEGAPSSMSALDSKGVGFERTAHQRRVCGICSLV